MDLNLILLQVKMPVTALHVVSVVVGMGAALMSDILFNFYAKDKKLNDTEKRTLSILSKVVWFGLIAICLTGVIIFFTDTAKYMASDKFLAKMTILGVLLLNGIMLNYRVWPHVLEKNFFSSNKQNLTRRLAFFGGAVSVISWISVCALGVFDIAPSTYGNIMAFYLITILFGGFVALITEIRSFEK